MARTKKTTSKKEVKRIIDVFVDDISKELSDKGRITIKGFGTFRKTTVKAHEGVNIKTGKKQKVKQTLRVSFKASPKMKKQL